MIGTGLSRAITRSRKDFTVQETTTDRARRLHRVFGDVLPDGTADDQPDPAPDNRDRWLRDNRPPHHDLSEG